MDKEKDIEKDRQRDGYIRKQGTENKVDKRTNVKRNEQKRRTNRQKKGQRERD